MNSSFITSRPGYLYIYEMGLYIENTNNGSHNGMAKHTITIR